MPISLFSKLPQCLSGAINVNKSFFHGSYLWSQLAVQTDLGIRASETMLPVALKCFFCVRGQHVRFEQMIRLFIYVLMISEEPLHILGPTLQAFKAHEGSHRTIFSDALQRRGTSRCRCFWLCRLGGFALGSITALFGLQAIAATTAAVERVVLGHLKHQIHLLDGQDDAAVAAIAKIVADEELHLEQSVVHLASGQLWPKVLTPVVSASTQTVIWLGMRL